MKRAKMTIGNAVIELELAETAFRQAKGLMFRKSLGSNKGMLFVFGTERRYPIWMFGMRFPIDIIWIDRQMRVVDIAKNAQPCLLFCRFYTPKKKTKYILEANAGFAERRKVRVGSKAVLKLR